MLRKLILLFLFTLLGVFEAKADVSGDENHCGQESPTKGAPCNSLLYQNTCAQCNSFYEKEVLDLQGKSLKKAEALLENKDFQELIDDLQGKLPDFSGFQKDKSKQSSLGQKPEGSIYIFVSFSMGEKALLNLALEAKEYSVTFVLKGFVKDNYKKTVQALEKIITQTGQGFIIDPELYSLFSIDAVPTFVLTKPFPLNAAERTQTMPSGVRPEGPFHDRLMGHVSLQYALEQFAKEGDMKDVAQALLNKGARS